MKKYAMIALLLFTAACSCPAVTTEQVLVTKPTVVMPDANIWDTCPQPPNLPSTSNLTDMQVETFIAYSYKQNVACYNTLNAVKTFLENAKKTTESPR